MGQVIIIGIIAIPFILSGWNVFTLIKYLVRKEERDFNKVIEVIAMGIGLLYLYFYAELANIVFVNWDVQLYNLQKHSMIMPDAFMTITTIFLIALIGYMLIRFIAPNRLSPIVSALAISAIYLGIGICLLWCIQTISDFYLVLFPANCIIIFVKAIYIFVYQKNLILQTGLIPTKFKKLSSILNRTTNLPWIALLMVIPLLGVIIVILVLFGQEPNSVIKAWTETADWTMSQKVPPQNIQYDEHYLCTVAAGGHRSVVKPIRIGMRHGRRIVVNRQLCVANAFEQVLEEKTPGFHKLVRAIYDRTGYPISKHIQSKYLADLIYISMKPLEWIFLFVLYTVDVHPENRIAVQYPHTPVSN